MSIERFNQMVKERGFHWAYAMYEPTPEDREAEAERLRAFGRKIGEQIRAAQDQIVMDVITSPPEPSHIE